MSSGKLFKFKKDRGNDEFERKRRLFWRNSYHLVQFFIKVTNFLKTFSRISKRFLISTFLAILWICIQNKQLQPKIMKDTSKQLKRIWYKLVLNIQLNKRKLNKQQKAAAISLTFYSYHYTDMWWTREYQSTFSACGSAKSYVRPSWCWYKLTNITWREERRERGEGRQKKC